MPLDTLAVHTRYRVVSPATHVAFVQHVRELKAVGRHRDAGLWTSVVEFQHIPVPDENPRDIEGLPPLPKAVCSLAGCMRCESRRGGFHFPWLGVWCKRTVVPRDDATVAEAFQDLDSDPNYMDALQLQMYGSGCTVEHFLPPAWHNVFVRAAPRGPRCLPVGGIGRWAMQYGVSQSKPLPQVGSKHGKIFGSEDNVPWWGGGMRMRMTTCLAVALPVECHHGMFAQLAFKLSASIVSQCWGPWARCVVSTPGMMIRCDGPCQHCTWGRTPQPFFGPCSSRRSGGVDRWNPALILCGVTAWVFGGISPVECMEDDIRPSRTSSGSTGGRTTPEDRGLVPAHSLGDPDSQQGGRLEDAESDE